jgi:tetratricopeptide (TPR) repeat protein
MSAVPSEFAFLVALLVAATPPAHRAAAKPTAPRADGPAAALDAALAAAEAALRADERLVAESGLRQALLEGWLLRGALDAADGRWSDAKDDYTQAATAAVETRRAYEALALVHLQLGEPTEAVERLTRVVAAQPKDGRARRLLAQALIAQGKPEQAVQELEEARSAAPDDLELAFALATGYLRVKRVDAAARLFDEVAKGRPMAATHVLIGRTYRDHREFARARSSLHRALALDPKARRAHFYLGTVAALADESAGLDDALAEFAQEHALAPDDPLVDQYLGIGLVEARRYEEALPLLEAAAKAAGSVSPDTFYYAGRCHLALGRPAEAARAFARALQAAPTGEGREAQLRSIHYQLGTALRAQGKDDEAAVHFAEAEKYSRQRTEGDRERLARYLSDAPMDDVAPAGAEALLEGSPVAGLDPGARGLLRAQVTAALVRASMNLGILHAQAERFVRAAEMLEHAAALDPDFPQVQYSLGVAYFNAGRYAQARGPLARAYEADASSLGTRRMLALAHLHADDYAEAAQLLERDPERETNPQILYAYGLALVRGGHAAEAQSIFARLVARHGDSAEVNAVLGQAEAQDGDYESAERRLRRALELKKDTPDANGTLGVIYLKQGRLAEAEKALRAELAVSPEDARARQHLAAVLEMDNRAAEALPLLRSALRVRPDYPEARYLLGKILLAQGEAALGAEQLEVAARLQPDEANVHYQLAQAYRRLGRAELAEAEMAAFQKLKEKRREVTP